MLVKPRKIKSVVRIIASIVFFSSTSLFASEVNTGYFGNVAIKGYDPVAYFTEQKAVKGSSDLSHTWLGAEWNFSSEEHRSLFKSEPIKYVPQYGGYCAGGLAYGDSTTNIDPEAWKIIDGKLYLNYDPGTAEELVEVEGHLEKTQENWPAIQAALNESYQ